ncbi:MAG: hypothetical protein U7126_07820 [Microcoleus sp.]
MIRLSSPASKLYFWGGRDTPQENLIFVEQAENPVPDRGARCQKNQLTDSELFRYSRI